MAEMSARAIARAYHDYWTAGRFEAAAELIGEDVVIETPINSYPRKADFVAALKGFGALVQRVDGLVEASSGDDAVQVYDMEVSGLGMMRIAEHFTVRQGRIVRLAQIHDTAALRAAGFVRDGQGG